MLNILYLGDIVGRIGREAVKKALPRIKKSEKIDFVVANAENIAHGSGTTEKTIKEMLEAGIDAFTTGDHAFDRENSLEIYNSELPLLRPANFPAGAPGFGYKIFHLKDKRILIINLIGRTFMQAEYDCPFRRLDEVLSDPNLANIKFSAILIDIHAEATSEKVALKHHVDGRVSAVIGSHTHVLTADERISKLGTAFITDAGMSGIYDECIGVERKGIIDTFITQIKNRHVIPEQGTAMVDGIKVSINTKNGHATGIKRIEKLIKIK